MATVFEPDKVDRSIYKRPPRARRRGDGKPKPTEYAVGEGTVRHRATKEEALKDEADVVELYLKQWPHRKIAAELHLQPSTVMNHIARAKTRWRESSIRNFDELREQQLAKIDKLEGEYWDAWEASKTPLKTSVTINRQRDSGTEDTLQESHGDSRFLQGIERCIERRCKLLGLDAPTKIEQDVLVREYVGVSIEAVMGQAKVIDSQTLKATVDSAYIPPSAEE